MAAHGLGGAWADASGAPDKSSSPRNTDMLPSLPRPPGREGLIIVASVASAGRQDRRLRPIGRRGSAAEQAVDRRQHEQREQRRGDEAADDDRGERALHLGARARGQGHRHEARATPRAPSSAPAAAADCTRAARTSSSARSAAPRGRRICVTSTTPFSTATPKRAMNPTPAEIENGMPRSAERDDPADGGEGHVQVDERRRAHRAECEEEQREDERRARAGRRPPGARWPPAGSRTGRPSRM